MGACELSSHPSLLSLSLPGSEPLSASLIGFRRRGDRRDILRSVTRGVGTTLYMSPEQRAAKAYDFKVRRLLSGCKPPRLPTSQKSQVDIYSLGVILLEMCHPISTAMERIHVLSNLQVSVSSAAKPPLAHAGHHTLPQIHIDLPAHTRTVCCVGTHFGTYSCRRALLSASPPLPPPPFSPASRVRPHNSRD